MRRLWSDLCSSAPPCLYVRFELSHDVIDMPTAHQTRVLAALLALQRFHGRRWWSRSAIGEVIRAGGYHDVIQRSTIRRLKEAGLVWLERDSWPAKVRKLIRCRCGRHCWGLTRKGAAAARKLRVAWPPDIETRLQCAGCHDDWRGGPDDDEDPRDRWRGDDDGGDDDDSPSPAPAPLEPCVA